MKNALSPEALSQLYVDARTFSYWLPEPVSDELLHQVYELTKLGATSANSHSTRFFFVKSPEAKKRLEPALNPTNVDKVMSAPVTVIVAVDQNFHEQMPTLMPMRPESKDRMGAMPAPQKEFMTTQGAGLEAAYLMLAARSLGLDCGPMGGFDRAKVDAIFFEGLAWKSQLLVNLGHGDASKLHPRLPRLPFDVACRVA
jgi:3-hydroxypropanoate dehydrogenase